MEDANVPVKGSIRSNNVTRSPKGKVHGKSKSKDIGRLSASGQAERSATIDRALQQQEGSGKHSQPSDPRSMPKSHCSEPAYHWRNPRARPKSVHGTEIIEYHRMGLAQSSSHESDPVGPFASSLHSRSCVQANQQTRGAQPLGIVAARCPVGALTENSSRLINKRIDHLRATEDFLLTCVILTDSKEIEVVPAVQKTMSAVSVISESIARSCGGIKETDETLISSTGKIFRCKMFVELHLYLPCCERKCPKSIVLYVLKDEEIGGFNLLLSPIDVTKLGHQKILFLLCESMTSAG